MTNTNKPFETNTLYHYANEYRKNITDENEIEKIDMTAILEAEEEEMIKRGEIIIENVNAKMRLGKSTLADARALRIFELLKKYKKQPKNAVFGMKNIARDDQEFSKMMRDPKLGNTVIVTDESNELEQTGENVTVENALKRVFSDVQAGRYVHRVCCSPKETIDPNADILLSVIAVDHVKKVTRAKLYYRFYEGGQEFIQLLGFVDTYVGHIIGNWLKIKELFFKFDKTEQEKALIERYRQEDWYVEYMIKKYEKMRLITDEGIFKPRILDYAEVILRVVKRLKPLTKMTSAINIRIVRNFIKMEFRKDKIPTSIVGISLATDETQGVLDLWISYWKMRTQMLQSEHRIEAARKGTDLAQEEMKLVDLEMASEALKSAAQVSEAELEHYIMINKKYHMETSGGKDEKETAQKN